jgi:hypothetical protein
MSVIPFSDSLYSEVLARVVYRLIERQYRKWPQHYQAHTLDALEVYAQFLDMEHLGHLAAQVRRGLAQMKRGRTLRQWRDTQVAESRYQGRRLKRRQG